MSKSKTLALAIGLMLTATVAAPASAATRLYEHGDILTMQGDQPQYAQSLVERDGVIVYVGDEAGARRFKNAKTKVVDLKGKTLLPAFIDTHSHIMDYQGSLEFAALSPPPIGGVKKISDITDALHALQARMHLPPTAWLQGRGYDPDFLDEHRHPTAADLDVAFPNTPVVIVHASGHMLVANTAALRAAGVSAATADPSGGTFVRKAGTNEPEGLVQEMAMMAFAPFLMAEKPMPHQMALLRQAQDEYLKHGVTTAQDGLSLPLNLQVLQFAADHHELKMDVVSLPAFTMAKEVVGTGKIRWGQYDNHLKYGGLKIAVDGSPQGKTAFLTQPYLTPVPGCDQDCRGFANMTQDEVNQLFMLTYRNHVQLWSHCNGDAAIDMMIKGHEAAVAELGDADRRTVIIHSQIMRPDQLQTYQKEGLWPTFFSNHTFYWGDQHLANLGAERAGFISPLRSALALGIKASNHTDNIVTPIDQMMVLWSSVNRLSRSGVVVGADERISPYQALQTLTSNAAYFYFEENSKGTLTQGKRADLVILDRNPLKVAAMDLKTIRVMQTIKDGRVVFDSTRVVGSK